MSKLKTIKRILGIDFETANQFRDSACAVGLYLKNFNGEPICEKEFLINPECEFNYFNSLVNGITAEMVKGAPSFAGIYGEICSLIDDETVVVAHNASFDISVLRRTCEKYGLSKPSFPYLCTLIMSRALVKASPSYSLDYLAEMLALGDFKHHDALADAKMCVTLFERLMSMCECETVYQLQRRGVASFGYLDGEADKYHPCRSSRKDATKLDLSDEEIEASLLSAGECDEDHPLFGKAVVFTGTLESMTREAASRKVEAVGGKTADNVSKKVNYLVFGFQDKMFLKGKEKSGKRLKAEALIDAGADLQIIGEDEFLQLL